MGYFCWKKAGFINDNPSRPTKHLWRSFLGRPIHLRPCFWYKCSKVSRAKFYANTDFFSRWFVPIILKTSDGKSSVRPCDCSSVSLASSFATKKDLHKGRPYDICLPIVASWFPIFWGWLYHLVDQVGVAFSEPVSRATLHDCSSSIFFRDS